MVDSEWELLLSFEMPLRICNYGIVKRGDLEMEKFISRTYYWGAYAILFVLFAMFSLRNHKKEFLICIVLMTVLLLAWRAVTAKKRIRINPVKRGDYIIVFLLAFVTRMSFCLYMNSHESQCNDFAIVLQEAISGQFTDQLEYYRQYAHKIYYPLFLHTLGLQSQLTIFVFQALLLGGWRHY